MFSTLLPINFGSDIQAKAGKMDEQLARLFRDQGLL